MPRRKRSLDRDSGVIRDASLVVIASEDTHAVKQYFRRFRTRRLEFRVLETLDCRSSPRDVMLRIDKYLAEEVAVDGDQFWICIDSDHWTEANHINNLVKVLRECRQKKYRVAVSNPCFELWLLLHFDDFSADQTSCCCETVEKKLRSVVGSYRKDQVAALPLSAASVHLAIERASRMDRDQQVLPASPTTQVYQLLQLLLQRECIDLYSSTR
jgi:hypothetical protein